MDTNVTHMMIVNMTICILAHILVKSGVHASINEQRNVQSKRASEVWVIGKPGWNCGMVCNELGLLCDETMPNTLTTNDKVEVVMQELGYKCDRFIRPKNFPGAPFTTGFLRGRRKKWNNRCAPIRRDTQSSCNDIRQWRSNDIQALCYCFSETDLPPSSAPMTSPLPHDIELENSSFEAGLVGWTDTTDSRCISSMNKFKPSINESWREEFNDVAQCALSTRNAPPFGAHYMSVNVGGTCTQVLNEFLTAGQTYNLTVWSRGVNQVWGGRGINENAISTDSVARIELVVIDGDGHRTVAGYSQENVGAPKMAGQARADLSCSQCSQDDGANIWIDGTYRMHAGNSLLYTTVNEDPIKGSWKYANKGIVDGMALTPVLTPQGLKGIIATWYSDVRRVWSMMTYHPLLGRPPSYSFGGFIEPGEPTQSSILVQNSQNNEDPWAIDAYTFYDADEERLWMIWGGHQTFVSELDPETASLCCEDRCTKLCSSTEFDETRNAHTLVMSFDEIGSRKVGLEFSGDSCSTAYQEGPALLKQYGNYYIFSTYGSMDEDYTIRVCRSESPKGPYYDKLGKDCSVYSPGGLNRQARAPGSSMLLGPEGEQSVPGHPSFWQEDGVTYMGYDFRKGAASSSSGGEGSDYMAIRKINWIKDAEGTNGWWPTIWHEMNVSVNTDDFPDHIGKQLEIQLKSVGGDDSEVAFDGVQLISYAK